MFKLPTISGLDGSLASYHMCADVRLHILMSHNNDRLVFDFNGANDGATFIGQKAEFYNVVITRHHSTDGGRELLYPKDGTADDCSLVLNYVTFVRHTANIHSNPTSIYLDREGL